MARGGRYEDMVDRPELAIEPGRRVRLGEQIERLDEALANRGMDHRMLRREVHDALHPSVRVAVGGGEAGRRKRQARRRELVYLGKKQVYVEGRGWTAL